MTGGPVINPRIRVTYEFTSFGGYHSSPEDLEQSVDQWIDSGMCDREAACREISCEYLSPVEGEEEDYPVMTECGCGPNPEGPQPDCVEHGCPACRGRVAGGHVAGCLYRKDRWRQ